MRYRAIPANLPSRKVLWRHADSHTPAERVADYTQAIMDLGATVCVRSNPACGDCPLAEQCAALATNTIAEYPGRKPKKEKPVRRARIFVAHDGNGTCLVEQRPADGVWGGLWTPPERPADTSAEGFVQEFGLQTLEHADKHRTGIQTHVHPLPSGHRARLHRGGKEPAQAIRERDDVRWYSTGSNEPLGLSAPAVKLIASLSEFSLT